MNLDDLALAAKAKVPVPGKDEEGNDLFAEVRGLNLVDILGLVERHRAPLSVTFSNLAGDRDAALKSFSAMGGALLSALPDLAADVISVAMDQPEKVGSAKKISASVQLSLLEKIGELTFAAEGGPGKVIEIVVSALGGTTAALRTLGQPT